MYNCMVDENAAWYVHVYIVTKYSFQTLFYQIHLEEGMRSRRTERPILHHRQLYSVCVCVCVNQHKVFLETVQHGIHTNTILGEALHMMIQQLGTQDKVH
jgi:hypothetical protein